nr:restriction endonuclease subunit S [Acidithiobacillus thiooxidans]
MREGWRIVPMEQLCSIKSGKSDTKDAVADGAYAFFDRSRTVKKSSRYLHDCEALIIPGEGIEFLPRHFSGKFDLHQRAYALFNFSNLVDVKFLYHYLHYKRDYFPQVAVGATVKSLRLRHFEQLPVSLTNIPEQRRIVAILDEAFEGIATAKANAEKNLQNAREIFESHLNGVFSQRGEGWVEKRLGDVCRRITVGHVGPMAKQYKSNGIPFLRSQNIRPFSIDLDNVVFIDEAFHSSLAKSSLEVGDIAIVRTGYPGTAAVIPESLGVANCSDLVIVRPGKGIDAHFLAAFFNSQYGKQLVLGKIVGAAQKHFNVSAAKETVIYIPPVTEQLEIIRAANEMREETQHLESLYQQKLTALDELKQSLLHQAFNGDL